MSRRRRQQPQFTSYVDGLTSLRAGNTEQTNPDEHRDDMFSDPLPYFTIDNNFALRKSPDQHFADSSRPPFLGVPVDGPDMHVRRRTRGIAGTRLPPGGDDPMESDTKSPMAKNVGTPKGKRRRKR